MKVARFIEILRK